MLSRFFAGQDERGMAFLYRMTELLRQAENDKLNLARYAYLLARLQPKRSSGAMRCITSFPNRCTRGLAAVRIACSSSRRFICTSI